MKISEFEHSKKDYQESFERFKTEYQLHEKWFARPDHIAIKCADEIDYAMTVQEWMPHADSDGLWEIGLDGRYLASGHLANGLMVADIAFDWLEIMQPRPGREQEQGYVEHTEFIIDDFRVVWNGLVSRGVPNIDMQDNPGHKWINILIDEKRQIKFNDTSLEEITANERKHRKLQRIE